MSAAGLAASEAERQRLLLAARLRHRGAAHVGNLGGSHAGGRQQPGEQFVHEGAVPQVSGIQRAAPRGDVRRGSTAPRESAAL